MFPSSFQLLIIRDTPTSPGSSGPELSTSDTCALRAVVVIRETSSARQQLLPCVQTDEDPTGLHRLFKAAGADTFVFPDFRKDAITTLAAHQADSIARINNAVATALNLAPYSPPEILKPSAHSIRGSQV